MPGAKFHFLHYYEAFGKERCSSSNSGTGGTGSTEEGHLPTSGASGASGATRPHTAAESGDDGDDDGQERKEQETVRLRTEILVMTNVHLYCLYNVSQVVSLWLQ